MNRTLMAAEIARRTGLTKPQATAALDALGDILVAEAKGRRSVQLGGLFTVDVVHRPERVGRNPRTGEPLTIAARDAVRITPKGALRAATAN